jgi:hypothetical protein
MHPEKTRIVYCKDSKRRGSHEHTRFEFLSYEFRARRVRTKAGKYFDGFNPAISSCSGQAHPERNPPMAALPVDDQDLARAG